MSVIEELRSLEEYFSFLQRQGIPIVKLYEQVQSVGNVVPRLYLLCCIGSIYIVSKEAPAKDILRDLVEMCKGVQHPIRGLFLRNYLTSCSKNKLPDIGSEYEGIGGTVEDACQFILQNFAEANRLWVRLQTQGAGNKNKKKRESERHDVRVLVGLNLVTLSQLEGLTVEMYREIVLPRILDEIINCKDTMAQNYLMDCVIQVFPDEMHLGTLDLFLDTIKKLKEKTNVKSILQSMQQRLGTHVTEGGSLPPDIDIFHLFNDCITGIIEERSNMPLEDILTLQHYLLEFTLVGYPTRIDYISHCLECCSTIISKTDFMNTILQTQQDNRMERLTDEVTIQIESLLLTPLDSLAIRVLDIPPYSKLMTYLPWGNWKEVSVTLVKAVLKSHTILDNVEVVEQLLNAIKPLLQDATISTSVSPEAG
jgi:vacuolar protein sorting-associated protein 35